MIQGEVWKIAIDALRANKVKALLTMLGVVIGSACIVLVVTISLIGKSYIIAQIEGVGANIVYGELRRAGLQNTTFSDEIKLSDLEAVHDTVPAVVRVAGTHDVQMSVVAGGVERPVTLVAVTQDFQAIRNLLVTQGRYFDDSDMKSRSTVSRDRRSGACSFSRSQSRWDGDSSGRASIYHYRRIQGTHSDFWAIGNCA